MFLISQFISFIYSVTKHCSCHYSEYIGPLTFILKFPLINHDITGGKSQPGAGQASTGVCNKFAYSFHSTSPIRKVSLSVLGCLGFEE